MNIIIERIAKELSVKREQIATTINLIDEGATIPFIARYRKEVTGGLDDTQLRTLHERLFYLRELEERRQTIIKSIEEQNKLTPELAEAINNAETKTRLEDLYLPYKLKRRTKAQIAREAGLSPLAEALLENPNLNPEQVAQEYLNPEHNINDAKTALEGARQILMEQFAEEAELLAKLRHFLWENGLVTAKVMSGKEEGIKFTDYFSYEETIKTIPSHRALALFRARNEGIIQLSLGIPEDTTKPHPCERMIAQQFSIQQRNRPADPWLQETVRWAWRIKIATHLEVELLSQLKETAETEAIRVFSSNLKDLLLAAPAGARTVMGLDPGLRTGVKVAIVDATGKLIDTATIYPHPPKKEWALSIKVLAALCQKHQVQLISIGNGTASRETDKLAAEIIKQYPHLNLHKIVVSEAGASVYSASELAAKEFPELDVSIRGAVSIARRLQDPLAELVKIEPKAIGVGQYQHDVNQGKLAKTLGAVIEDCVNAVGVDVNTASIPLLARVSGLNETIARNIIELRNTQGPFQNRLALKKVPRFGDKTFEQAAGFLRITNGSNLLDTSAVHPEAYPLIEKILAKVNKGIKEIIGDSIFLKKLNPSEFTDEQFGLPTVTDILKELDKPGRDPRPEFKTATFQEGIESIGHLKTGMIMEGVITNITNFGAFVDIGVHQDGLVHISAITNKFIKDPREVVKTGDIVKVKVIEVDIKRHRIALSMRLDDKQTIQAESFKTKNTHSFIQNKPPQIINSMSEAFAKLKS